MRKNLFLKMFLVLILVVFTKSFSFSQLFVENFNYPVSSLLTANGWTAHSGAASNSIAVIAPSISYSTYLSSGIGNEARLINTGEDVHITIPAQTSGVVYASFLVNVDSATTTGDYFFHVGASTISTVFRGRLFVRRNAQNQLSFGIAQSTTTANYTGFDYSLNTTYLIVVRYELVSGTTNDIASFIVNPPLNAPLPTTGWITNTDASGSDLAQLGSIALRQGASANAPMLKLDGIRVSTLWHEIVGTAVTLDPTIVVNPDTLNNFNYQIGSGPSTSQSFVVSGTTLNSDIIITAPTNYEISLTSTGTYSTTLNLTPTSGIVNNTSIFVRLKSGLTVGNFNNQLVTLTSTGAVTKNVVCNGSVTPIMPLITVNPISLSGFTYVQNLGPSAEQSFAVEGSNLTSTIVINAPVNYEISLTSGSGFTNVLNLTPIAGAVSSTNIFVRLAAGFPVATYNQIITLTSTGALDRNVAVNGSVTTPMPSAVVLSRPSFIDISSANSQSAILMSLSNYPSDSVRYRLFSGANQYFPWNNETGAFVSSSSYANGPLVPGTPSTNTIFWIVYERGTNISTAASYRDRLAPYSTNFQTTVLPAATEITAPFTLSGVFNGTPNFDNSVKRVVLAYSGTTLVSAATTNLGTGTFDIVCPIGTTIDKIEIRSLNNTLISERTGSWSTTANVGFFGTPISATLSNNLDTFIINLPSSISTTINWNNASSISSIVDNQTVPYTLTTSDYGVVGNVLTISQAYLATVLPLYGMSVQLTINFDVGAPSVFTIHSISTVGINEVGQQFAIFPNPSDGRFVISVENNYTMSVFDIFGKLLHNQDIYSGQNEILLNSFSSGNFVVKISNKTETKYLRLVIK